MHTEPQPVQPGRDGGRKLVTSIKNPRILLAEDDLEMRKLLAWRLRANSFFVVECADGYELLDNLGSPVLSVRPEGFDLIISDIRMPGVTGLEVLQALQETEWYLPMILITAFGDAQTHDLAEQLGAAALFDKPFEIDALIERVREVLVLDSPKGNNWSDRIARREGPEYPIDIVYNQLQWSTELEAVINTSSRLLQPFAEKIIYCRVVLEGPRFPKLNRRYHVQIMVTLPDEVLVIRSNLRRISDEAGLLTAVRDAFGAMRGKLRKYYETKQSN